MLEEKLGRSRMSIKQAQVNSCNNLSHTCIGIKKLYRAPCTREIRTKNIGIRQVEESMKEEEPVNLQFLNDKKEVSSM